MKRELQIALSRVASEDLLLFQSVSAVEFLLRQHLERN
jgi:hypothetical protein